MSKFSWINFDNDFITSVVYSTKTSEDLKPKRVINDKDKDMLIVDMDRIAPYPSREFVITYRKEIESNLLINYPEFIGKIYQDIRGYKKDNYRNMLTDLSRMELGNTLINRYISVLSDIGSPNFNYEGISIYEKPVTIDLTKSHIITNEVSLYDFQQDAIKNLKNNLLTNNKTGNKSGMLVMPTGSGKTMTSVHFLLDECVSQGYQVIWLTHRHMLIDQTASTFYKLSPIVKNNNKSKKELTMTCVSGEHSSIRATEKGDDILIISVQSGFRGLDYLKSILGKKVIIVVDEAHHTVAMSYRRIIDYVRRYRKEAKLLGLTATPIRGTDDESTFLRQLYNNNLIYSISMSELITKNILADPVFETISTNSNFEPIITIEESNLIKKYGEVPATLANKIAQSSKRNKIIVDTYMKNKDKYGKTLIFALNGLHCFTLNKEFQKRGIRSDFVYSGNSDNEETIRKFKENKLDVLININILTEGSDVPDIQTVFLTRPTSSEGLLIQMIGRGLRGIRAGGTDKAIIVDFCDKWETFNKWLNPEWIISNEKVEVSDVESEKTSSKTLVTIPWNVIDDIYESISFDGDAEIMRQVGLPFGWYKLIDLDEEDYTMLMWREQLTSFKNIVIDKAKIIDKDYSANQVIYKYFHSFNMPPTKKDMEIFLFNLKNSEPTPKLFKFKERNNIDPINVVDKLMSEHVSYDDIDSKVRKIYIEYEDIIQSLYGDLKSYTDEVENSYTKYGKDKYESIFYIEEIPEKLLPYEIIPTHNLGRLMQDVIDEMFSGSYEGIQNIYWTAKPAKGYFARYFPNGSIQINKMLDSPQVDEEVIKFLIYHELLHRDYWKHDKYFYREEHKYPNYTEHNRFLDHKFGKFKFEK